MIVLQLGTGSTAALVATGLSLLSTVLGLAVAYIAFQGYRRNGSRPMLYVAAGFFLVFWTPVMLFASSVLAPVVGEFTYGVLGELSQVLGLVSILYGLRMPMGE